MGWTKELAEDQLSPPSICSLRTPILPSLPFRTAVDFLSANSQRF